METGKLSVVATPIGNLEDITYRAVRVLSEADYILCEDTRVTSKLLNHYKIENDLRRYDAHTSEMAHVRIIEDLQAGKHLALVSDAGTPGVSDPGVLLIDKVRMAQVPIEVIPGPSAVTAAVSMAGITGNQFAFLGYIPQKKGRETFFKSLSSYELPIVCFESTHRIIKTLETLRDTYPDGKLYIGRELTKLHEEMLVGTAESILETLQLEPVRQKGEFVIIFDGRK